jgi:hypothetical protein
VATEAGRCQACFLFWHRIPTAEFLPDNPASTVRKSAKALKLPRLYHHPYLLKNYLPVWHLGMKNKQYITVLLSRFVAAVSACTRYLPATVSVYFSIRTWGTWGIPIEKQRTDDALLSLISYLFFVPYQILFHFKRGKMHIQWNPVYSSRFHGYCRYTARL